MKLMRANEVPEGLVNNFLENNPQVNKQSILQSGYVVEMNDNICGCFVLKHIKNGIYVLRQLFVTATSAINIPIFIESILQLAAQMKAREIFVHSHKLMIDIILEALQFHPQEDCSFLDKYTKNEGKWWSYAIS